SPSRVHGPVGSSGTATGASRAARSPSTSTWSLDELIVTSAADEDLALLLQLPDRPDDGLLGLLDLAEADRSEDVDLVEQGLPRALGEVAGDLVAHDVRDALERGRQHVGLDLAEHLLDRAVVERGDVLEHEH